MLHPLAPSVSGKRFLIIGEIDILVINETFLDDSIKDIVDSILMAIYSIEQTVHWNWLRNVEEES